MVKAPLFLTDGFEETEALTLRRGEADVTAVSMTGREIMDRARRFAHDVDMKLLAACGEAQNIDKRLTHEEVMEHMRGIISSASKEI